MNIKLNAKGISVIALAIWPAIFTFLLPQKIGEIIWHTANQYIYHPPSIRNITFFWLAEEPISKRIYTELWFLNSIFIALIYARWLINHPEHLIEMDENASLLKSLSLSIAALIFSISLYSEISFSPTRQLSEKTEFLITNNAGLFGLLPAILIGAACAPVGAICSLIVANRKINRLLNRNQK